MENPFFSEDNYRLFFENALNATEEGVEVESTLGAGNCFYCYLKEVPVEIPMEVAVKGLIFVQV